MIRVALILVIAALSFLHPQAEPMHVHVVSSDVGALHHGDLHHHGGGHHHHDAHDHHHTKPVTDADPEAGEQVHRVLHVHHAHSDLTSVPPVWTRALAQPVSVKWWGALVQMLCDAELDGLSPPPKFLL